MAAHTEVTMDWSNPDKGEAMKLFKQQCEMIFRRKNIKKEDQVDEILLRMGITGLKKFNSWGLTEAEQKDPETVWRKFLEYGDQSQNHRIARLALRNFKQKVSGTEVEPVEEFLARCRLQAQLCKFAANELDERIIEQLIAGTVHPEVQKELLGKDDKLTLSEATQIARKHEASLHHMKQLVDTQPQQVTSVNAMQRERKCGKCGQSHAAKPREICPAYGAKCYQCGKQNHYGNMCRRKDDPYKKHEKSQSTEKPQGRQYKTAKPQQSHRGTKKYHCIQQEEHDSEEFDEVQFSEVTVSGDKRDEAYAKVKTRIPGKEHLNISILAKVDTGAQGNILPTRVFKQMNISPEALRPTNTILTAYNGTIIPQEGVLKLKCKYKAREWKETSFFVAETTGPIILGLPACLALNLVSLNCAVHTTSVPLSRTKIESTKDLVKQYPEQFDRIGHFPGKYHIVLNPDAEPIVHAPRKCPIHLKPELKEEIEKMVKDDVIKKVDEPTPWVSSLTYSRKSNGQLRICLDPKDLNRAIRRCHHKTPTLEELTHSFSGAKVFTKMDAKNGYWAIELDEESQYLTTFNSPFGRYCYKRMPFGLVMSQDVYQSRIDQIVEQCPGVVGIADDMVVYGRNEEEHDKNLLNLMEVAKKSGLTFNSQKCGVKLPEITFFGHVFDQNGARPDPKKVEDIQALPAPQSKQQVQEFLGIVTYLAPFIPQLSQKTATIRDLLKNDSEFQWNASHQQAFNAVKEAIAKATTLAYYDPMKETTIQVDASSRGLGAVLMQEGRPIAFASKSLTETERRYANIEREMLAVVFGCKRFHTYVYASHFTIESDHKPLEMISKKNITCAPPRLQRMLLETQGYDFDIKYRPGKEVMLADGLSRLPNVQKNKAINLDLKIQFVQITEDKMTQLKRESARDETIAALKEIITEGWPKKRNDLPIPLRQFWSFRDEFSVLDTLVLKGERIFIPTTQRESILARLHSSHQGVEKTRLRARTCVYWPMIDADIENAIKECEICQANQRSQQKETLIQHETPTRPWEVLGTDLFHFEGENYLIVADYYSKFFFVRKVNGQCTSRAVVDLTKQLFGEHGVPAKVMSDNGRHYDSECYREFAQQWEFEHITSSPHYPQSNGFIERTIQTVKNTLKKCSESNSDKELALLSLRTTPISNTIPAPAELLYTRKLKSNLPVNIANRHVDKDRIYEQLTQRQEKQKEYHDRTASDLPPLYHGQPVYVQDKQTGRWDKGSITRKREEPRSYDISMPNGKTLRRNRKQLRERAELEDEEAYPGTTANDAEASNSSNTANADACLNDTNCSASNDDRPNSINKDICTGGTDYPKKQDAPTRTKSGRTIKKPGRFRDEM